MSRTHPLGDPNLDHLRQIFRSFPLFIDIVRNVEMALSKADFGIARLYATLVPTKPSAPASSPCSTTSSPSPPA